MKMVVMVKFTRWTDLLQVLVVFDVVAVGVVQDVRHEEPTEQAQLDCDLRKKGSESPLLEGSKPWLQERHRRVPWSWRCWERGRGPGRPSPSSAECLGTYQCSSPPNQRGQCARPDFFEVIENSWQCWQPVCKRMAVLCLLLPSGTPGPSSTWLVPLWLYCGPSQSCNMFLFWNLKTFKLCWWH